VADVSGSEVALHNIGQETERLLVGLGGLVEISHVLMSGIGLTFSAKMSSCREEMRGEQCSSNDENHTSEAAPDAEIHVASACFLADAG
jgi:hypothetical protein